MKKYVSLLLSATFLCVALTGCGDAPKKDKDKGKTATPENKMDDKPKGDAPKAG